MNHSAACHEGVRTSRGRVAVRRYFRTHGVALRTGGDAGASCAWSRSVADTCWRFLPQCGHDLAQAAGPALPDPGRQAVGGKTVLMGRGTPRLFSMWWARAPDSRWTPRFGPTWRPGWGLTSRTCEYTPARRPPRPWTLKLLLLATTYLRGWKVRRQLHPRPQTARARTSARCTTETPGTQSGYC